MGFLRPGGEGRRKREEEGGRGGRGKERGREGESERGERGRGRGGQEKREGGKGRERVEEGRETSYMYIVINTLLTCAWDNYKLPRSNLPSNIT